VRLWCSLHCEPLGLVIVFLVFAAIFALFRPEGRPTTFTGFVTAINVQDAKRRPPFNAWVAFDGGKTIVSLPAGHGCVVGSRIALEKSRFSFARRYFGEHYTAARHACDTPAAAIRPATARP
jgi:hypothetical protein